MIVPTPEYDPLFADDGVPFAAKMRRYIAREFADVLGPRTKLLDTDQGLESLSRIVAGGLFTTDAETTPARRRAA